MTTSTDVNDSSFSSTCSNSTLDSSQSDDVNSVTDTSSSSCEILELSDMETEIVSIDQFLEDQQSAWQDVTSLPTTDSLVTDTVTNLAAMDSSTTDSATISERKFGSSSSH